MKNNPLEYRAELYLKTERALVAWFRHTQRTSDEDIKISGQFDFIKRTELSDAQIDAVHDWLIDQFNQRRAGKAMPSEAVAA